VSVVLAIIPALLVSVYVEAVPTMLVPVTATLIPLAAKTSNQARSFRLIALVLLLLVVALGGMSVGQLFIPSMLAMAVAYIHVRRSSNAGTGMQKPSE
jgi:hypothetical protein